MLAPWDGGRDVDKYAAPDAADWQNVVNEVQTTQQAVIEISSIYSNAVGEDIVRGQPLILETGSLKLASQDSPEVIGVSLGGTDYITQGQLTLDDWSTITDSTILIPGEYYYLADQKGKLTHNAPSQTGTVLVIVGRAQTANTIDINVQTPIYM